MATDGKARGLSLVAVGPQKAVLDFIERGVAMDGQQEQALNSGGYDEHFAAVYECAKGATDPFEAQGVVRENILAAGLIDYVYELGERMGVFRLADALVMRWASGAIDVAEAATSGKLYRYWKLRDDRSSPEERGMLYKRVLNKGNTEVTDRMVSNGLFTGLWSNLMTEVTEYIGKIEKIEDARSSTLPVSRSSIFQAIRELQYNLSKYATGMAHMQVRELYSQLTQALDTLGDPELIAHFGGTRRKSVWTVIEKLGREELDRAIAIGPSLRLAVDGNRVFQTIAEFDNGVISDQEFTEFLAAAESYILNSAVVDEESDFTGADFNDFDDFEDDELDDDF